MKMILISILLFINLMNSLKPGVKLNIDTFAIDFFEEYLLPKVNKKIDYIQLHNYSRKVGTFQVNITNAFVHFDPVYIQNIRIQWWNMSSQCEMTVYEIDGNFQFDISYELWPIRDKIEGKASFKYQTMDSIIKHAVSNTGAPATKVTAKFELDLSDATLEFTGGVSAKILELLEPIVKQFLYDTADVDINKELYLWIQNPLNEMLSTFQVDIPLYDKIIMNYEMTAVDIYYGWTVAIPLSGYAYKNGQKFPPPFIPNDLPYLNTSKMHWVQYYYDEYTFNSILKLSYDSSKFQINYNYSIGDFILNLNCLSLNAPTVLISNIILSSFPFKCNVNATNTTDMSIHLFNVTGNTSQQIVHSIVNNSIKFQLSNYYLQNIQYEKDPEFNVNWFDQNIIVISEHIFITIDLNYFYYTLQLPMFNHTIYSNTETNAKDHYIGIYTDITYID